MNRADFQRLAEARLNDAQALLKNGRFGAAYYFGGYVVECALKARIAKLTKMEDFPPKPNIVAKMYVHNPSRLLRMAGLEDRFNELFRDDIEFGANWGIVAKWSEESRYEEHDEKDAAALVNAIANLEHGVLICIKKYW